MKKSKRALQKSIDKVLREQFGLTELRPGQEEVIHHVLQGRNTLAILPTGAGKSLCYQLPGVLLEGTTVVVSPLISLMKDQREKLDALELSAASLNSSISAAGQKAAMTDVRSGSTEYVYVTPERLANEDFLKSLKKIKIDLFVIDEAHCISHWGHDFRPAYLSLKTAIKALGSPPVLALTATATADVAQDIQQQLGLDKMEIVATGVMRANLHYEAFLAETEDEKRQKLLETLRRTEGSAIVYTSTVKLADELSHWLTEQGIPSGKYHARMSAKQRTESQDAFMRGEPPVIVATSAFGLGIDKPNTRAVIHFNFPASLDAYYQESGRAGRDGEPARCTLLYLKKDKSVQSFFMAGKYPKADDVEAVFKVLLRADDNVSFPLVDLGEQLPGLSVRKLSSVLHALENMKLVRKSKIGWQVRSALRQQQAGFISDEYKKMLENDQAKLRSMIIYAQTALCRWHSLLQYFGETSDWETCGHCDNCLDRNVARDVENLAKQELSSRNRPAHLVEVGKI